MEICVVSVILTLVSLISGVASQNCILEFAHDFEFSCDVGALKSSTITWRAHQSNPNSIVILNECKSSKCQASSTFNGVFLASATTDSTFSFIVNSILFGNLTTTDLSTLKTLTKLECAHGNSVVSVCDNFDVYADAKIQQLTANNATQLTANPGDKVHIECVASGFPTPSLWIGKNGTSLTAVSPGQGMNITLNTCLDAATYVCRAETHNTVDEKGVDVFINCPLHIMNTTQAVIDVHSYDKPKIVILVYGYPSPNSFSLERASGEKVDNATVNKINYYSDAVPYGRVEVLFHQLKDSEFTNYILTFCNGVGKDLVYNFTFHRFGTSTASTVSTMAAARWMILGFLAMIL